jgi:16S rRNA (uracil1498-N3)-methyltransferase
MHRFFLPDFQQLVLSAAEAHHATHVLRLKPGDTVNVFDGRGHEAQCRVGEAGKLVLLQQSSTPPLPRRVTLAQAVPKKNMDLIVEKATELGVTAIIPLLSERTIVQLDENARKLERWRDIALESCKQCGNNWLPVIEPPRKVPAFLADTGPFDLKLIASLQPGAQPLQAILGETRPQSVLVLIGPEGDFTPAEISSAKNAGCWPLSLGPLVLRAETAAIYALSILHHELQTA